MIARLARPARDFAAIPRGLRAGFSLVELLVVIAIVGTLSALVLSAVQRVRESSRNSRCLSNIRQAALGVVAYESARRLFPVGCDFVPAEPALPGGTEHAWSSFVLPFIEEVGLAGRIDYRKLWNAPGGNDAAANESIGLYRCPSGVVSATGKADYAGIAGAVIPLDSGSFAGAAGLHSGMLAAADGEHRAVKAAAVTDGLSHTLLIGEAVDRGSATVAGGPADANGRWARINCFAQSEPFVNGAGSELSSHHGGGCQVAYADGRAVFLSDTLDPAVLAAICTRAGGEALSSGAAGGPP